MANLRLSVFTLLVSVGFVAVANGQSLPINDQSVKRPITGSAFQPVDAGLAAAAAKATRRFQTTASGGVSARSPGQPYKSEISSDGKLSLSVGANRLGVFVQNYGFGDQRMPVTVTAPWVNPDKTAWPAVQLTRPGISESYVNGTSGLHHWLTVNARPATSSGSLWVNLAVTGARNISSLSETATEVTIGATKLKYSGLKVWDASGRTLPAQMVTKANGIGLVVDDANAEYPVTIDPVWGSESLLSADPPKFIQHFGWSVAVAGNIAVVGTDQWEEPVYVFQKDGSSWSLEQTLTSKAAGFGNAVATNGEKIAVGAPYDNSRRYGDGSVTLYERTGPKGAPWEESSTIFPPDEIEYGQFGSAIAMDSSRIVIGAPSAMRDDWNSVGKACVYQLLEGRTRWEATLVDEEGPSDGYAGSSIAISGDNIILGAPGDRYMGYNEGSAAVYSYESLRWSRKLHLQAPDRQRGDQFGRSVAISTTELFVGAPGYRTNSVFVFTDWKSGSPSAKSIPATGDTYEGFGYALGFNGTSLFIGNYQRKSISGEVSVVNRNGGGTWEVVDTILPSHPNDYSFFGQSLAVSPTDLIVGAWQGHQPGQDYAGSAVVYSIGVAKPDASVTFPGLPLYGGTPGIYGSKPGVGTVTLSTAAPSGGITVELSSDSPSLTVPSSVTIPEGTTSTTFDYMTSSVDTDTATMVTTGGDSVNSSSGNLSVLANKVAKVVGININSLGTGLAEVRLAVPAASDFVVNLTSEDPSKLQVPDSVTVLAGKTSAKFTVTSLSAVITSTAINITANPSNGTKTATITVVPQAAIDNLSFSESTIVAGTSTTGTVFLAGPAPVGGQVVTLTSNRGSVTVPSSVFVPAGETSVNFTATSTGTSPTSAIITATVNGQKKTDTLTIIRPRLASISLANSTVQGGVQNTTFTVSLVEAMPFDVTINLSSNRATLASVPATIIIPAGNLTATGNVTTGRWTGSGSSKAVNITARYGTDSSKLVTLTVTK